MASKNRAQKAKVNAVVCDENKPIRILHYIGSLNIGGSQMMIMNVYRNIDRKKIQFDFIIDRKNEKHFAKEIESLGGRVYVFDEYFNGRNYFKFKRQWADFFKSHPEYRIIHCHVRSVASIVLKIAKKNGLKTICHSHSISNGSGVKSLAKTLLQKRIVKYSDLLLACSKDAAVWLFGEKVANSKNCIIIKNAIDAEKYQFDKEKRTAIRTKYGISEDEVLIGHVGRFSDEKNHSFMVDLMDSIKRPEFKMIFCGDGKAKDSVKHMASHNKNILFYDDIYNAGDLYSALDVFILPSKYEGLGMALVEAQFNGLTCIVSNTVPEEAKISEKVFFLPLVPKIWLSKIENSRPRSSFNTTLSPKAKSFMIKNSIATINTIYYQLLFTLEPYNIGEMHA